MGVPYGHWKTTTFVAGLHTSGLVTPLVLDGPINGETFLAYDEQTPGADIEARDIVFMYNLGAHKIAGVRAAIEAVGAGLLYLPP